jgi:hypothetical protein
MLFNENEVHAIHMKNRGAITTFPKLHLTKEYFCSAREITAEVPVDNCVPSRREDVEL